MAKQEMLGIHVAFVVLLVGVEAFFTGLAILNVRYGERAVAESAAWIEAELGVEDIDRLSSYHRLRTGFGLLSGWFGLLALFLVLYSGLFADAVGVVNELGMGPIGEGIVFFVGGAVVLALYDVPFDLFSTFVIEDLFDFNEQSVTLWLRDTLLNLVITTVIVAVVAGVLLWTVETIGQWWLAGIGLVAVLTIVLNVVIPRVIMPLFYDFERLDSGDLREAIEDVFDRAGFECEQIYEMNASSRSSKSNAFFAGFGRTKRVVLFDTLIDSMEIPEIQAVLAHELAHWKKGHIWKRIGSTVAQAAVVLFVLQLLVAPDFLLTTNWLYEMFGVTQTPYAGLVLATFWVQPIFRLTAPIRLKLSLAHEREADAFAADVMGGPEPQASALAKLADENLANPFPHPWYEAFHYDHPPIPDRIRTLREKNEGTGGA
ncbi:MAG: STE24 endopeptidase [Halobacteriales archaeon]|jgi:STE24 endopeptidase